MTLKSIKNMAQIGETEIMHIFLPSKLPGEDIATDAVHCNLILLLRDALETFQKLNGSFSISKTLKTFHNWTQFEHIPDSNLTSRIQDTIAKMEIGDLIAFYLPQQNAGILISVEKEDKKEDEGIIVLSSFQVSSSSNAIMSKQSNLLVDFPEQSIRIPKSDLFLSQEFANILKLLMTTEFSMAMPKSRKAGQTYDETRDVTDPMFVTDWLTHLLCDENSETYNEFPQIRKKIRDDVVLGNNVGVPFRRSGLWMTAKVALQISLIGELGGVKIGTFIYKWIMLTAMRRALEIYHTHQIKQNDAFSRHGTDLQVQMMRKIARRMVKLKQMSSSIVVFADWDDDDGTNLLNLVSQKLNQQWENISGNKIKSKNSGEIEISESDKEIMLQQISPKVKAEIETRTNMRNQAAPNNSATTPPIPNCPTRLTSNTFPTVNNYSTYHEADFELFEIENWVRLNINSFVNSIYCRQIKSLITNYSNKAMSHYKNDPIANSRLILTVLKCIQILDKIATEEYSLYEKYNSGIDLGFLSRLVLPRKCDMEMSNELEKYFLNRNNGGTGPSLISEKIPGESSFAVQFARQSKEMITLRSKILKIIEEEIENKKEEAIRVREECQELQRSIAKRNCEYRYDSYLERDVHSGGCTRCSLKNQLDIKLVSVSPYEKRLSDYEGQQQAVVFELLIPEEIAILRDMLYFFKVDILNESWLHNKDIVKDWVNSGFVGHYQNSNRTNLKLGSTTKASTDTHYTRNMSVDNDESDFHRNLYTDFILNNGYDQNYHGTSVLGKNEFIPRCTFFMSNPQSNYKGMQWAINWTDHTPNTVLARQCQCPPNLSIKEFIQFGSLRAGSRIQYRNIILALTSDNLSWKAEEVFVLLCQAQFQFGISHPEAHLDLLNNDFITELLQILEDKVDSNEKKWSEPYTLCCFVVITCRVLEVGNMENEASNLLRKCRKIAVSWITKLGDLIGEAYAAPETEKNALKLKLVLSALALTLTYHVSPEHINFVMSTSEDLLHWLTAISTLQNEVFWNFAGRLKVLKLTDLQRCLLRLAICTGLSLEPVIHQIDKNETFNTFTSFCWKVSPSFPTQWVKCNSSPQIYECPRVLDSNGAAHHIYLDLIFGRFLVDGLPLSRLPEQIIRNPMYQRVFQKAEFTVQPNIAKGLTVFTTTSKYNNCAYVFYQQNSTTVIQEDGEFQTLELIPHSLLENDFPVSFSQDYSHWWNSSTKQIVFRITEFDKPNFTEIKYEWDLDADNLKEIQTARQLVSVHSHAYHQFCVDVERIEPLLYIHAWQVKNGTMEIELTRLGLKFYWSTENPRLVSREFPDMYVDPDQNIGTLVGLENKLVLIESAAFDIQPARKVIIPHGHLQVSDDGDAPQHVIVELSGLRSPRFYVYNLEYHRRILEAVKNQSAWLYLAALHGATASPLPDTFTGVTGTEMAFQILQSARVWSCQPYDEECYKSLSMIAGFSPKREFYPKHLECMQKVIWPSGLPSTCAHEGFSILVDRLLEDSEKLRQIFPDMSQPPKLEDEKNKANQFLSERHYWRHSALDNSLLSIPHLDKSFPTPEIYERQTLLSSRDSVNANVRELSYLCGHWKSFFDSSSNSVRQLLISSDDLSGIKKRPEVIQNNNFVEVLNQLFFSRDTWIDFYRLAIHVGKTPSLRPWWAVILSSLVFVGVDVKQLRILHTVAVNWERFEEFSPPDIGAYTSPSSTFSNYEIQNIFTLNGRFNANGYYSTQREKNQAEYKYITELNCEISEATTDIKDKWIPRHVISVSLGVTCCKINTAEAMQQVNVLIKRWYENSKLDEFLENFEKILSSVILQNEIKNRPSFLELTPLFNVCEITIPRPRFDSRTMILESEVVSQINIELEEYVYNQQISTTGFPDSYAPYYETTEGFLQCLHIFQFRSNQVWEKLVNLLNRSTFGASSLISSGLYPRLVPSTLFPILLWKQETRNADKLKNVEKVQNLIGAVCVYWTLEQKMKRCIRFIRAGPSMEVALLREKETVGFKSFSPRQNPEWLLLELELNMTIRPIQVKVARAMLEPTSGSNSVLQLNMGEGKTSLIVPMLTVSISDGCTQLCRVTVIKSIFETNVNWLKHTLGGLINRRVYLFPCRRDIDFSLSLITNMQSAYEECLKNKGIVVTLPEFRLSFQLKGYEFSRKGNVQLASALVKLQNWLDKYSRDILDESDEILSVKYQLIYTIGSQVPIGGGELRWQVIQKLLKRLPAIMLELKNEFGESAIEYFQEDDQDKSIFPSCRLLRSNVYQHLINKLANVFIDGKMIGFAELRSNEKPLILKFLTDNAITNEEIETVMNFPFIQESEENISIILILAGYLRFGVLESALSKRWRVNYGVNPKGHRKMAVPFKAKDVASERTEFGHPDMAIILTQISYYYSGLTDDQLRDCFSSKEFHINPTSEYAGWIQNVPPNKKHPSVREYNGVNLEDHEQRTLHLFPILRKCTTVIDFWLSNFVYPKESKQFEGKMTCTAWDLVSENKLKLTTGFSGTNDSANLLPGLITQNDLPELQGTNRELECVLMRPEMLYRHFASNITSIGILQQLNQEEIKVLLDCGALMLQLDNEQVAVEWMKIDQNLEAVVFFNKKNVLTVKEKERQQNCPFELSPFRERLDVCGIYLDDEHTRGTDLKFPQGSRACVTLGNGLTRDKMVQACMRMRMLGMGHVVTFWSSNEVHNKIQNLASLTNSEIEGRQVLDWVKANSKQFEEDGMIYWTNSAVNYAKKRGGEIIFFNSGTETTESYSQFGKNCSDAEVVKLRDIYCHARNEALFSSIYPKWFKKAQTALCTSNQLVDVNNIFTNIETLCKERINKIIPKKNHFSQLLDEEQEKELEKEVELEVERQLPGPANPCSHQISNEVLNALFTGLVNFNDSNLVDICYIAEVFSSTTVNDKLQPNCWGNSILCTRDFKMTVEKEAKYDTLTDFLRPVNWIVKLQNSSRESILLSISSYEANELIPKFRTGYFKASLHLFNARTLPNHKILIDNRRLTLPSSSKCSNISWSKLLPPLYLCSGNLYFQTSDEEEAFSTWLGLIPRPRSQLFQQYFDQGLISQKNGFVPVENRNFVLCPISQHAFESDPESLVAEISRIRNESQFPEDSHVAKIVVNGMKSLFSIQEDADVEDLLKPEP